MEFDPQSSTQRWALGFLAVLALGGGFLVGAVDSDDGRPRHADRQREAATPSATLQSPAGDTATPGGVEGGGAPEHEEGQGDEGSEDEGADEHGSSDPEGKAKGHDKDEDKGKGHEGND